jgi:hypothetical protein
MTALAEALMARVRVPKRVEDFMVGIEYLGELRPQ